MITIVSGCPRSGTSLMCQMLHAGGMPILQDGGRETDGHNPEGYWEYQPFKRLPQGDVAWLEKAEGICVKIVSPFLRYLPPDRQYKIVYMLRDLDDVARSQAHMAADRGTPAEFDRAFWTRHVEETLEWAEAQDYIDLRPVRYADCAEHPQAVADLLAGWLPNNLDAAAMPSAVRMDLFLARG